MVSGNGILHIAGHNWLAHFQADPVWAYLVVDMVPDEDVY